MRLETCIRKGLGLKAHRVREVREEGDRLVAEIEWIEGRRLSCGRCPGQTKLVLRRQLNGSAFFVKAVDRSPERVDGGHTLLVKLKRCQLNPALKPAAQGPRFVA
jgi:hypothetical protein